MARGEPKLGILLQHGGHSFFFFLQTLEQELISIPVTIKLSLSYNFLKWLVQLPLRHLIAAGNCRFPMFDLIAPEATFITWIPKCLSCNPLDNENKLTMLNYFDWYVLIIIISNQLDTNYLKVSVSTWTAAFDAEQAPPWAVAETLYIFNHNKTNDWAFAHQKEVLRSFRQTMKWCWLFFLIYLTLSRKCNFLGK